MEKIKGELTPLQLILLTKEIKARKAAENAITARLMRLAYWSKAADFNRVVRSLERSAIEESSVRLLKDKEIKDFGFEVEKRGPIEAS